MIVYAKVIMNQEEGVGLGLSWKLEDTRLNITAIQPSKSLME
jgi:hypothetical protein